MIKLTYSHFMGFPFTNAMQKLTQATFHSSTAYKIKKIASEMNAARETIKKEYLALVAEYAQKDEKGEIIRPDKDDPNSFDVAKEKMEEFRQKEKEFGTRTVTINRPPLPAHELGDLKLSAGEIGVLEHVLLFPEDAPVSGNVVPLNASVTEQSPA